MFEKAKSGRDAFTFSLGGMTTIASFAVAPAVDQQRLNRAMDQKQERKLENQPDTAREIENFLARYFAPGRCQAA